MSARGIVIRSSRRLAAGIGMLPGMPALRVIGLSLLFYLFAAAVPVVARSGPEAGSIDFDVDPNGAVVMPVFVDGLGPFRFLVDTGSTSSAISDTAAAALGLRPIAKAELVSASGRVMVPVVRLGRTTVGAVEREGLLASLVRAGDLDQLTAGVQGVLGQDFLSGLDYTLDYQRGRFSWGGDPAIGNRGTKLALTPSHGRFLVELPQDATGAVVRLVPDSGSATLVVFEGDNTAGLPRRSIASQSRLTGMAGGRLVRRAVVPALQVGGIVLHDEPAAIVERSGRSSPDADGLLPLHRFARVSFLARERCLYVVGR